MMSLMRNSGNGALIQEVAHCCAHCYADIDLLQQLIERAKQSGLSSAANICLEKQGEMKDKQRKYRAADYTQAFYKDIAIVTAAAPGVDKLFETLSRCPMVGASPQHFTVMVLIDQLASQLDHIADGAAGSPRVHCLPPEDAQ